MLQIQAAETLGSSEVRILLCLFLPTSLGTHQMDYQMTKKSLNHLPAYFYWTACALASSTKTSLRIGDKGLLSYSLPGVGVGGAKKGTDFSLNGFFSFCFYSAFGNSCCMCFRQFKNPRKEKNSKNAGSCRKRSSVSRYPLIELSMSSNDL